MSIEIPEGLRYTTEHEWVRGGNTDVVRIGVTSYAAEQLGDIVYVTLPEVGESVTAGESCGELESTKSVSDIYTPVDGTVTAVNPELADTPELINNDPYGAGWLFEVEAAGADLDDLYDAEAYGKLIENG